MKLRDSNLKLALKNLFLPKRKNWVVLEPHMGLGDSLICVSLIKTMAFRSPETTFLYACLPHYFHSVAWMFKDIANVFPLVVSSGREARQYAQFKNVRYEPVGIKNVDIQKFDQSFYQQHQIPFETRWELAKTSAGPKSRELFEKLNPKNIAYMLVCKTDSSNRSHQMNISNEENLLIIEVEPKTNNIFDWTELVLAAKEIHTIDTAFIHLVENILDVNTNKKLCFHKIRQSPTEFTRRLPWNEILY